MSKRLKNYLLRWNRDKRKGLYLPEFKSYYRKGGWLVINRYKWNVIRGIKDVFKKGYAVLVYGGDAGVVEGKSSRYAIAVLSLLKTKSPWQKFRMTKLSRDIYRLMESR